MATAFEEERGTCAICFELYRKPMSLKCGHIFCTPCIEQILERNQDDLIQCSLCRVMSERRDLRRDFTMEDLVENLKLKPDPAQPIRGEATGLVCDLCRRHPFMTKCKQCSELMCKNCAEVHLRSKATRDHELLRQEDIKATVRSHIREGISKCDTMCAELRSVTDTYSECSLIVKKNVSMAMKEVACVQRQIKDKFDSLYSKIKESEKKEISTIESYKEGVEEELTNIQTTKQYLEEILSKDDSAILCRPGILEQIEARLETKTESISPQLLRQSLSEYHIDVVVPAALKTNLNGMMVEIKYDGNLLSATTGEFVVEKQRQILGDSSAMRLIGGYLWYCDYTGMSIYDDQWREKRRLTRCRPQFALDVVQLPNGCILAVGACGIFSLGSTESETTGDSNPITPGWMQNLSVPADEEVIVKEQFHLAQYDEGKLYALNKKTDTIHIFDINNGFKKLTSFKVPCTHTVHATSFSIRNGTITACCLHANKIYVLSLDGQLRHTYGDWAGHKHGLKFDWPYICQEDQSGLLIVEYHSHRLLVLDKQGQCHPVNLPPLRVVGDQYLSGALHWKNKIFLALCEDIYGDCTLVVLAKTL